MGIWDIYGETYVNLWAHLFLHDFHESPQNYHETLWFWRFWSMVHPERLAQTWGPWKAVVTAVVT